MGSSHSVGRKGSHSLTAGSDSGATPLGLASGHDQPPPRRVRSFGHALGSAARAQGGVKCSRSSQSVQSVRSSHSLHALGLHRHSLRLGSFGGNHDHSVSWQVLTELASEPGFKYELSQFEIIKQIGSGAFGRVLLCRHTLTGQKVVLKTIEKTHVVRTKQLQHLREERNALRALSEHHCPFVVHTVGCFQDEKNIYFVMEYVPGGELFAHLRASSNKHFSEKRARFYVSEAVLALQHMHEKEHMVYRDIKPENMLVDERGHLRIVDFGFAKQLDTDERTYTFCGTPDYLAPEVVTGKGSSREADYWALGVLTYELLVGHAPFMTVDARGRTTYKDILNGKMQFPRFVGATARDFISQLLVVDPAQRLGHAGGLEAVKAHAWFAGTDWEALLRMEVKAPRPHKYKKGTVNLQPPQDPRQPAADDGGLDEETRRYFSTFDFVVRPDQPPASAPMAGIAEEAPQPRLSGDSRPQFFIEGEPDEEEA